ncbi:MAG: heparan-alpha-glucosaminide N-acetyltransferase domain-containing protein [Bacteroidota bacterium]
MTQTSQRFLALDVFRGLTVCLMIIVNTPGDGSTTFAPLNHAKWDGFTPTDLVFPSFLFAVGNAMSFVMNKWRTLDQAKVLWKILKRTLIIFLLGYLMYWFPFVRWNDQQELVFAPFSNTRVFGVLQRIALCYGIGALLVYYFKTKTAVWIGVAFLVLYWMLLYFFGAPGDELSLGGNAVLRLDQWLIGDNHLYHGEGVAFDPEGLLSTLPAVANVIGGYAAGKYIQQKGNSYEGLAKLMLAGAILLFGAYCWNFGFPINKKLWSSSFVLHTVGLDCIILGIIIYITQFLKQTSWAYFFEVFGRNPLFIYLLSEVVAILLYFIRVDENTSLFNWIYENSFKHLGPYVGSLGFALSFMLFCWLVGYLLDKRKVYVRV